MKVRPVQNYTIIEVMEYNELSNGLVLPIHLRKKKPIGKIVDKGPNCSDDLKIEATVIFTKQSTKPLPDGDLVIVPEYRIELKEI
jgi:co-chaperonin GroES (HSP10)